MSKRRNSRSTRDENRRSATRVEVFAEAYVRNGGCAAKAARTAGFATRGAHSRGFEMLARADVQEAIRLRQTELMHRYRVNTENTIEELASMAFFDPADFFDENGALRPIDEVPLRARQALAGFKARRIRGRNSEPDEEIVEIRFLDRGAAIERLMRHLGLFEKDRRQKPDAVAELLAHVAANGAGLAVKPRPGGQGA